jgi:two-component system, NtrC family, nitrogen regulation sensor histidine kinase GlnL
MIWLNSYEGKIKTFLGLLVLFLGIAIYVSFHLLVVSRNAIFEEVRQRIALAAEAVESDLKVGEMGLPRDREAIVGSPFSQSRFARIAAAHGLVSLELLDPGGRVLVSSLVGRIRGLDPGWGSLGSAGRRNLETGNTVLSSLRSDAGVAYATMTGYRPLLDAAGRLTGVIKVEDRAENLARVERSVRILSAIQAAGLSLLAVLIFFFARWILAPYRKLMATADQARLAEALDRHAVGEAGPEPDFLVASFQAVLEKLKGQELELHRLKETRGATREDDFPAESVAESLNSGMMTLDREGRIRLVNPAALQILGMSRAEVAGRSASDLFGTEAGLGKLLLEGILRGQPRSREMVPHARPDGKEIHLGVGLSPVHGSGGEVRGLVCLLSDLTEIRSLRDRVALKENLAQLGELSAGIAHEFRNSLATIQGYARLITRRSAGEERELAASILKEVQGISKVVEDFLQFARPAPLNLSEVDVRGLLEDLAREMSQIQGTPMRVLVEGDFPAVSGDEPLLKQAFHNLIRNAAQAANGQGVRVTIRGRVEESHLSIELSDDGPGIPPDVLPHIFTPFFTTRPGGSGLGLPLVQRTIVSHDGSVDVASQVGRGTSFQIRLPLPRAAESLLHTEPPRTAMRIAGSGDGKRNT